MRKWSSWLLSGLLVATGLQVRADEGMWLLPYLQKLNIKEMKAKGLKLSSDQIYNVNGNSLKDAIVIFGGGCTGEIVSANGLVFTNHHCGYASIQQHSSVEHDYLTDGFWATSREMELPTPGLKFTFMGVDLSSYYKKTADGYQIFLAPANVSNDVQLTLKEMIGQFNGMAGEGALSEDDVKSKIAEEEDPQVVNAIDFDSVKFCLKMLFLNIESKKNGETEEKTVEYALSLQINAEGLIPKEIKIFQIDSLSFNIWNTQRQTVLEKMALITPDSF